MTRLSEFLQDAPLKYYFVIEDGKKRQATEDERLEMINDARQKELV
jgi:hypothetical protein